MRLFILARHAESAANVGHFLSSNPSRPIGLTSAGREQARQLGEQLAHLPIDLAVASSFPRARETVELALQERRIPLLIEPDFDEIRAGIFDGIPIERYWRWTEQHSRSERFPSGESFDEATQRYATALQRVLARTEKITLIVGHELAIRSIVEAAAGLDALGQSEFPVANAVAYLFDEHALRRAVERLDALAPTVRPESIGAKAAA